MLHLPKIGLDLDGVIIDHTENKRRLSSEEGVILEPWQTNSNVLGRFLTPELDKKIHAKLYSEMSIDAPPVIGSLENLATLKAEFYVVSARHPETIRFVQQWLGRYRFFDLVPASRIYFCGVGEDKRAHAERLKLDAFMDDNLRLLSALPYSCERLIFDHVGAIQHMTDVPDWAIKVKGWGKFRELMTK